ncbi:LOW QUALITY PROTEIN: daf-12-interacting protein 1-like [Haliotis rubra]|uniref:LOW QUALITY PROTEIN: daf-12-interacting protein 1-like n=1 Tax=Haliotis rubra TaxID=36100 RepID=UPI001EE5930D|nr:LOW QUALITY PROTEIN: daf-12-interacting protein 1-like [Haliotis rubra]
MGQSGSAQLETLPHYVQAQPLPVKKVPPPRPSSPPKRPRTPSKNPKYAVPENRVLPVGELLQRKLRPVSQEMSKQHPEFADLFPKSDSDKVGQRDGEEDMDVSDDNAKISDKCERSLTSGGRDVNVVDIEKQIHVDNKTECVDNKTDATVTMHLNDVVPDGRPSSSDTSTSASNEDLLNGQSSDSRLRRTHSLDRAPMKPRGHRRHPSMTMSLINEEHTIFEDPRESLAETRDHLYDNWRKEPYTNAMPTGVSLPVRSNFDIDVTYNMTYAQLAEHRRQKHLEEVERKTGISVGQLQTDLADNSNIQYNPFLRQASRESTRSTSTASSETGVSKRKKKRAPPPPGSKVEDNTDEPPVDYDMDEPPVPVLKQHQRRMSVASNASIPSTKTKAAPPPPINGSSILMAPTQSGPSSTVPVAVPPSPATAPAPVPAPVPAPLQFLLQLQLQLLNSLYLLLLHQCPLMSPPPTQSSHLPLPTSLPPSCTPPPVTVRSVAPSDKEKEEKQAISKLDELISSETTDNKPIDSDDDGLESDNENEIVNNPTSKSPEKRLNSLVNGHDESERYSEKELVLKPKLPTINLQKPKDQNEIFREQLARAYEDRAKRREEDLKRKEEEERKKKLLEQEKEEEDITARLDKKHGESVEILRRLSQDLDKKWISSSRSHSPEVFSSHETHDDDDLSSKESKSPGHCRVFSEDWTPEHDLGSDDDIEDRHTSYSHQRSTSEGFKSSIVPTKFNALKKNSKGKYIRKQSESSNDDKHKYGSIRKLKKTVNKSVRNAFGSLSRASGKLLRKQKSMDFESTDAPPPPPPPSNWHLSASSNELDRPLRPLERRLSQGNILTSEEESSDEEEEAEQPQGISSHLEMLKPELNGYLPGQTNSLQRGNIGIEKPEGLRLYKKKNKKKNGYVLSTNQERDPRDLFMSEQIKVKERQIEMEKHKQLEMEKEMLRLKSLEQEERFQRLQTAHFQQQLQILQQNISSGESTISAPPLPPAGGLPSYNLPEYTGQSQLYPHVMNQGQPAVTQRLDTRFSNGANVPTMPNLTSIDINYLSNLMRMNGVQPPTSSQQWAYLLNSVSHSAQPRPSKSMYSGPELSSESRQLKSMYVTTNGPDLTKMFQGRSLDDNQMSTQKHNMMDFLGPKGLSQSFCSLDRQHDPSEINNLLHEYQQSANLHAPSMPSLSEKAKQRSNPMYYSSDEEDLSSGLSPARTSRDHVVRVHVKDFRDIPQVQQHDAYQKGGSVGGSVYTAYHVPGLPTHLHRFPREEDSSSGADR